MSLGTRTKNEKDISRPLSRESGNPVGACGTLAQEINGCLSGAGERVVKL